MYALTINIKKNETAIWPHVYQKGAPNGVEWVMHGWDGSCMGGVGHAGLGWVMQGWGGSCRGGVSHTGVG